MAKWNKKLGLVFVNFGLLAMAPNFVNADSCYDPCCDPCSFGGFDVGVDFLYWKPCVGNLDYAVVRHADSVNGTTPIVTTSKAGFKTLCLDWEPGFRIRAGKDDVWCNWRLEGSYTWLSLDDHASTRKSETDIYVASPLFHPQFNTDGFGPAFDDLQEIKGHYDATYQTWDVLLSYDIACNRCHNFQPFFGVEGLIFNQEFKVAGLEFPDDGSVDAIYASWKSDFFGVGLKIGTAYEFQMFDCLKFYGKASGTITVGNHDGEYRAAEIDASGNKLRGSVNDDDCCQFVPGCNLALGFLYETCMCGYDLAVKAGWEFTQWYNVSNARIFSNGNEDEEFYSPSSHYTNPGFQGLVVGVDLSF